MATSLLCLQDLAAAAASAEGLSCVHLVKSECSYYHYLCDGVDDRVSVRVACSACVHVMFLGVWFGDVMMGHIMARCTGVSEVTLRPAWVNMHFINILNQPYLLFNAHQT